MEYLKLFAMMVSEIKMLLLLVWNYSVTLASYNILEDINVDIHNFG